MRSAAWPSSDSSSHIQPSLLSLHPLRHPQPEDYEETKREFLGSLAGGAMGSTGGSNGAAAAPAAAAAAKPPQPPPKPVSWSIPPPAPHREQLQQQAAAVAAPAAAPQQPPAAAPAPPAAAAPTAAAAAAAMAAPAAAPARQPMHRVPSNPDVPTNIPKMGGIKQLGQGVSAAVPTARSAAGRMCGAALQESGQRRKCWAGTLLLVTA